MNRTLVEMVRAMLADAKLPKKFWAEALSTAVYLRNRCPTKAVEGMTPVEAWTGEKPGVGHLRAFGCVAYAHVAKDERQKLDMKSRKCIFLGYCTETKGYRLYDTERARVFISRDVLFHESDFHSGAEKEQQDVRSIADEKPRTNDDEAEPVPRRSNREKATPNYYGQWVSIAKGDMKEPATVEQALASPDRVKWQDAMEKELESLHENGVWELVELPRDRKANGCSSSS